MNYKSYLRIPCWCISSPALWSWSPKLFGNYFARRPAARSAADAGPRPGGYHSGEEAEKTKQKYNFTITITFLKIWKRSYENETLRLLFVKYESKKVTISLFRVSKMMTTNSLYSKNIKAERKVSIHSELLQSEHSEH